MQDRVYISIDLSVTDVSCLNVRLDDRQKQLGRWGGGHGKRVRSPIENLPNDPIAPFLMKRNIQEEQLPAGLERCHRYVLQHPRRG